MPRRLRLLAMTYVPRRLRLLAMTNLPRRLRLLAMTNVVALVTAAHLFARQKNGDPDQR